MRARWLSVFVAALLICGSQRTSGQAAGGDDRIRALVAEGDALSAVSVRRFDEAITLFQAADKLAAASTDMHLRALVRSKVAQGFFNGERLAESVAAGRQAASMAKDVGDLLTASRALRAVGSSLITLARFDESDAALRESVALAQQVGSIDDEARGLTNLSAKSLLQGKLGDGIFWGRRTLETMSRAADLQQTLSARIQFAGPFNLGKSLTLSGDYAGAQPFLDQAFAAAMRNDDYGGQMHILFDTGEWYEMQGDLDRAERYYERTVQFRIGDSLESEGKGHRGLGRVALTRGQYAVAAHELSEALRCFERIQHAQHIAPTLVERARAHAANGDIAASERDLVRAIAAGERDTHVIALVLARIERGRQLAERGALTEAKAEFDRARVRAEHGGLLPLAPAALVGRAHVAELGGKWSESLEWYERAANALDRIRGRISSMELRASFSSATHDAFAGMVRVLVNLHAAQPRAGYAARALAALERERRRAMDAAAPDRGTGAGDRRSGAVTRIAELQNALFAPDLDDALRTSLLRSLDDAERDLALVVSAPASPRAADPLASAFSAAELQRALPANTAAVAYAGKAAFVVTTAAITVLQLDVPDDLDARISFFISALESNARDASIASGRALAAGIIDPVLAVVPPHARLLITASGALSRLPFAALPIAADNARAPAPLFTLHEVTSVPFLTMLLDTRDASRTIPRNLLAISDAGNRGERSADAARLRSSRGESGYVAGFMRTAQLLSGGAATEHAVRTASAQGHSILHFATHASLDAVVPERSGILLGGSKDDDGLLQGREIARLHFGGALVVLSACRTADGKPSAAEGLHSLSRAFVQGGARTVVGALWDIPDAAAANTMRAFYGSLNAGRDSGTALRDAQLAVSGRAPYATSRIWAAFVLTGDPTTALEPAVTPPVHAVNLAAAASILLIGLVFVFQFRRRT